MTEIKSPVPRTQMTLRERSIRSQLTQLFSSQAMTKGSFLSRKKSCGKPTCKCARGEGHPTLCLVVLEKGKQRQIFIPEPLHQTVKEWVARYQKVKALQEELCQIYWNKMRNREV